MTYLARIAIVLALACASVGCGGPARLARYEISGTVTHDGKPVPSGSLRFTPDFDKGNRGPATTIMITDGTYRSVDGWNTRGGHGQVKNLPPRGPATMLHCLGVDHVRLTCPPSTAPLPEQPRKPLAFPSAARQDGAVGDLHAEAVALLPR